MSQYAKDKGSFRDRNSTVFRRDKEIVRGISQQALQNWERLSQTTFFARYGASGHIVATERVDIPNPLAHGIQGEWVTFLKHQRIPFVSYPYEWCFGMLKDAALLHLELLSAALDEDMILKDASAFNIQWNGVTPVFVDVPSFEVLQPGDPWVGYRQFCEMFLNPLMLQAYKGVAFQPWLRGAIDGIPIDQMAGLLTGRDAWRPSVFLNVHLQSKLQKKFGRTNRDFRATLRNAGFNRELIKANIHRLKKALTSLRLKANKSEWSDYTETHSYVDKELEEKQDFVRCAVQDRHWKMVWDLGCNTGVFSVLAAENADYVMAMDHDPLVVEHLYQRQKRQGANTILPLTMNIADPSPNLGWRGAERQRLEERGLPDLVLCLALIHHIVISANVPIREFIDWLASLRACLIIEFPTREDEMVQTLLANREDQYSDYYLESFEDCLRGHFDIVEMKSLKSGKRFIYFACPRLQ